MIPREAQRGRSFRGWFLYHMHDKKASTRKRIGWTQTLNMLTDDPEKAWKVMAYTAMSAQRLKEEAGAAKTGRKLQFPALSYSLSWHPEEKPDKEEMLQAVHRSIKAIGMEDYEALVVKHTDTIHPHLHIVINRVNPVTGYTADNGQTKRKLSAFALQWELEHGIYCPQRKENHDMRQDGKNTHYYDPIIRMAWEQASNGREFASLLEKHEYHLVRGRKRLVIVDAHGKVHAPTRHLDEINIKKFNQKLTDLDFSALRDADTLSTAIQKSRKDSYDELQKEKELEKSVSAPIQKNKQPSANSPKQRTDALNELSLREEKEILNLSRTFQQIIKRKRTELEQAHQLAEQFTAIKVQETKTKDPSLLQRIFGLHSYRRYKLKSLRRKFSTACLSIEKGLRSYEEEKTQSLDQLRKSYEQQRVEFDGF